MIKLLYCIPENFRKVIINYFHEQYIHYRYLILVDLIYNKKNIIGNIYIMIAKNLLIIVIYVYNGKMLILKSENKLFKS